MKNRRMLAATAVLSLLLATSVQALPPEVEANRLELRAVNAIKEKDWANAADALAQREKMGVKPLPQSLPYLQGSALLGLKRYEEAKKKLENYLALGTRTKYYEEALKLYNEADTAATKEREEQARKEKKYQDDLAKYEQAKLDRGPRIERCVKQAQSEHKRRVQEYEQAQQAAEQCSSGWGNAIGMAAGGKDRCAAAWERFNSKRDSLMNSPTRADDYELQEVCERRIPEPKPPARL